MLVEFQKKLPKAQFRFKNPLKILDSTTIPLCLSLFPWARYRKRKGALKIHTMLDGDHTLPVLMDITEGRVSDIKRARKMTESLSQDSILTMDLGYIDYGWLCELHLRHITFVTRSKKNMDFEDLGQHVEPHEKGVMSDRIILLSGYNSFKKYPHRMRRVTFFDEETEKELAFITNNLVLSAKTIAEIYKRRWDIENFFKWIKQNLKIKTFLGSSENAVLIQIWTAMIYYLILKYIQLQTKYAFSMLNLTRVVCSTLFKNVHMIDLLNLSPNQFKPPGYDGQQMLLFDG
jgi:transposase